jgi:hypothetical protein
MHFYHSCSCDSTIIPIPITPHTPISKLVIIYFLLLSRGRICSWNGLNNFYYFSPFIRRSPQKFVDVLEYDWLSVGSRQSLLCSGQQLPSGVNKIFHSQKLEGSQNLGLSLFLVSFPLKETFLLII